MGLIPKSQIAFLNAVSDLTFANPFSPERIKLEETALGKDFQAEHPFWSLAIEDENRDRQNVKRLVNKIEKTAEQIRRKIIDGDVGTDFELQLYDDLILHVLYYRSFSDLWGVQERMESSSVPVFWDRFSQEFDHWLNLPGVTLPSSQQRSHLYACFHQVCRAFFHIYNCVIGRSWPVARLRSRIWQSIFTHDMRRYRRSLYNRMSEITTLVTGPSGTGKELVARAIGLSGYVPFDEKSKSFASNQEESFYAINLSAFSPTLIESELFGHSKGAFTGANTARAGWLECCGPYGSVFLDEIGELSPLIQVKLLRLLQNRQFQRTGENRTRKFQGKIIAATNRDLSIEIQSGSFRDDLFYRLCSDVITTPSLVEQISECPDDLEHLVTFIVHRIAPEEAAPLTDEVLHWLKQNFPRQYPWPGNIRELEQCVRNIMIHNEYEPKLQKKSSGSADSLATDIQQLNLTADQLLSRYCTLAYQQTKSYEKAAQILGLDRRTVRAKYDPSWLEETEVSAVK